VNARMEREKPSKPEPAQKSLTRFTRTLDAPDVNILMRPMPVPVTRGSMVVDALVTRFNTAVTTNYRVTIETIKTNRVGMNERMSKVMFSDKNEQQAFLTMQDSEHMCGFPLAQVYKVNDGETPAWAGEIHKALTCMEYSQSPRNLDWYKTEGVTLWEKTIVRRV